MYSNTYASWQRCEADDAIEHLWRRLNKPALLWLEGAVDEECSFVQRMACWEILAGRKLNAELLEEAALEVAIDHGFIPVPMITNSWKEQSVPS